MRGQPDLSNYRLCVRIDAPLDRARVEPDDTAFVRHEVEVVRFDDSADDFVPVCSALVFRIRCDPGWDIEDAAEAEGDSPLLEAVCHRAVDADGALRGPFAEPFAGGPLRAAVVVDRIEFAQADDDTPLVKGLLLRGIFELLGRTGDLFFLPEDGQEGRLWARAVGAVRVDEFMVASVDFQTPIFPLAGMPHGVAEA